MASPLPEPVLPEQQGALLDGSPLGLHEEQGHQDGHHDHAARKEEEGEGLQASRTMSQQVEGLWLPLMSKPGVLVGRGTMDGSSKPTLREQSMVRKVCAMTALKSRLQNEATARHALRVSSGAISEGYSQARGP